MLCHYVWYMIPLTHLHHWAAVCKPETGLGLNGRACPKVIKFFPCSTQLSTKFILLINVKMPTICLVYDTIELYQLTHLQRWAAVCKSETGLGSNGRACPKVIKLFPCSTQLRTKYILLINVKMPTILA